MTLAGTDAKYRINLFGPVAFLTLPMLRLFSPEDKDAKTFENYLNPVMLVFTGQLAPSTLI